MKVLIIDDSDADAATLARMVEQQGHTAHAVQSLEAAAEIDLTGFDLALVDLWMPGYDPASTLEAARSLPIPYIVVTGDTNRDLAGRIGRLGLSLINKSAMNFEEMASHAFGLAESAAEKRQLMEERRQLMEEIAKLKIFQRIPDEIPKGT